MRGIEAVGGCCHATSPPFPLCVCVMAMSWSVTSTYRTAAGDPRDGYFIMVICQLAAPVITNANVGRGVAALTAARQPRINKNK